MINYTPAKALKPGMQVQVTETGHRAVTPDRNNPVWTVKSACPVRIAGKGGTEVEFQNGVTITTPSGADWIIL